MTMTARPLACDAYGNQFEVPDTARVWRVSKCKAPRRPPEPLYTREGKPLDIPIDTDHQELIPYLEEIGDNCDGKYRFDARDSRGQQVCATFAIAVLSGAVDDETLPRNAMPGSSVVDLSGISTALETLSSTIKQLIDQSKERDAETMKTLRQTIETLSHSNSAVSQTLARGYGDEVRPVRNAAEEEDPPVAAPAPPAAPPEPTVMDQMQKFLVALPDLLKAFDAMKAMLGPQDVGAAPAAPNGVAQAASNGVNGVNGVGGFHPMGGEGSAG